MPTKTAKQEELSPSQVSPSHESQPQIEEEPAEPESLILKRLGWDVCRMLVTKQRYYSSEASREVRVQPPYFAVLGLEENCFRTLTKEDIWKAFFSRRMEYKKSDGNCILEELIDPSSATDWSLVMEAFRVLNDPGSRAQYEMRNLMPHAQQQLRGLRVAHEAQERKRILAEAEAKAQGYASAAEMRAAKEAMEAAAAAAAAAEAEEEAKKAQKKKR